jgi:spore germination protein KA
MGNKPNLIQQLLRSFQRKNGGSSKKGNSKERNSRAKKDLLKGASDLSERENALKDLLLTSRLEDNLQLFRQVTGDSFDINIKKFQSGPAKVPAALLYIDGLVDARALEKLLHVVKIDIFLTGLENVQKKGIFETVRQRLLNVNESKVTENMDDLCHGVSAGMTALLFDGTARVLLCETQGWEMRSLIEPEAEPSIRGIRVGFVEDIHTNTALIRRRIRSPNLWIESLEIGSLSKTKIAFAYLKGLAGEEMLGELRSRLNSIDIDGILGSGYIEDYITDNPLSLFPSVITTERVDRIAGSILEGRVAIFTDGSSFALIIPVGFSMFLGAPDDYFEPFPLGALVRLLRYISFFIALFLPGIYVAVLTFHPELLPLPLLLRIQAAREGIPFPVVAEIIFMELIFEILREAGVRLPMIVGPAISIVGALVLGDSAIRAGLISPGVVIIVAFTAIASFTAPVFTLGLSARILRFAIIILGASLGLLGVQLGLLIILIHLVTLRSFGHPFMAPFAPFIREDMKDAFINRSWWHMVFRPKLIGYREPMRQRPGQKPRWREKGRSPTQKGKE